MNIGEDLARSFYGAFGRRDAAAMNVCYADQATFSDPVFLDLTARETRSMWDMLCTGASDLAVTFEIVEASASQVRVNWVARYTFSRTGRRVENRVNTQMDLKDGKVVRQVDSFDFPRWALQALGPVAFVLSYLPGFQRKVQQGARARLDAFMAKKEHKGASDAGSGVLK